MSVDNSGFDVDTLRTADLGVDTACISSLDLVGTPRQRAQWINTRIRALVQENGTLRHQLQLFQETHSLRSANVVSTLLSWIDANCQDTLTEKQGGDKKSLHTTDTNFPPERHQENQKIQNYSPTKQTTTTYGDELTPISLDSSEIPVRDDTKPYSANTTPWARRQPLPGANFGQVPVEQGTPNNRQVASRDWATDKHRANPLRNPDSMYSYPGRAKDFVSGTKFDFSADQLPSQKGAEIRNDPFAARKEQLGAVGPAGNNRPSGHPIVLDLETPRSDYAEEDRSSDYGSFTHGLDNHHIASQDRLVTLQGEGIGSQTELPESKLPTDQDFRHLQNQAESYSPAHRRSDESRQSWQLNGSDYNPATMPRGPLRAGSATIPDESSYSYSEMGEHESSPSRPLNAYISLPTTARSGTVGSEIGRDEQYSTPGQEEGDNYFEENVGYFHPQNKSQSATPVSSGNVANPRSNGAHLQPKHQSALGDEQSHTPQSNFQTVAEFFKTQSYGDTMAMPAPNSRHQLPKQRSPNSNNVRTQDPQGNWHDVSRDKNKERPRSNNSERPRSNNSGRFDRDPDDRRMALPTAPGPRVPPTASGTEAPPTVVIMAPGIGEPQAASTPIGRHFARGLDDRRNAITIELQKEGIEKTPEVPQVVRLTDENIRRLQEKAHRESRFSSREGSEYGPSPSNSHVAMPAASKSGTGHRQNEQDERNSTPHEERPHYYADKRADFSQPPDKVKFITPPLLTVISARDEQRHRDERVHYYPGKTDDYSQTQSKEQFVTPPLHTQSYPRAEEGSEDNRGPRSHDYYPRSPQVPARKAAGSEVVKKSSELTKHGTNANKRPAVHAMPGGLFRKADGVLIYEDQRTAHRTTTHNDLPPASSGNSVQPRSDAAFSLSRQQAAPDAPRADQRRAHQSNSLTKAESRKSLPHGDTVSLPATTSGHQSPTQKGPDLNNVWAQDSEGNWYDVSKNKTKEPAVNKDAAPARDNAPATPAPPWLRLVADNDRSRAFTAALAHIKTPARLIGEVAFQLDRRILNYVFNTRKVSKEKRRLYGYTISNILEMMWQEATGADGMLDDSVHGELRKRYDYLLSNLSAIGYDITHHGPVATSLVNKYGLLPVSPKRDSKCPFHPGNRDLFEEVLRCITPPAQIADVLVLLWSLAWIASLDGKPIVSW